MGATARKPTRLRVLKVNTRAARLYLRLGITQTGTDALHYELTTATGSG